MGHGISFLINSLCFEHTDLVMEQVAFYGVFQDEEGLARWTTGRSIKSMVIVQSLPVGQLSGAQGTWEHEV